MKQGALDVHALGSFPDQGADQGQGISEFGTILSALIRNVPGAVGAVLCDEEGDAIDFIYRANRLDRIDIQLSGSQIVQVANSMDRGRWAKTLKLQYIVIESRDGAQLIAPLGQGYVLSLRLGTKRTMPRAQLHFEAACLDILALLHESLQSLDP